MNDTVFALRDITMNGEKVVSAGDQGIVLGVSSKRKERHTRIRVKWDNGTQGNVSLNVISVSCPLALCLHWNNRMLIH